MSARPRLLLSMGLRDPGPQLSPRLRILDPERGAIVREGRLTASHPPPDGDQAASPCLADGMLWQPTRTAIHRVDPDTLQSEQVLTHPLFHDLHSVAPGAQGWLVTCTGHETVVEITSDGDLVERFSLGRPIDVERDYRTLPHDALKPHDVHPNQAFLLEDRRWVTCLGTARCQGLDHDGELDLGPGMPHDGVLREGLLWFTTTAGRVMGLDPHTGLREVELDLPAMEQGTGAFGWCRGIEVVGDTAWVGVTMLRSSAWRETARELVWGARGKRQPTRVLEIDWRHGRMKGRFDGVGHEGEGVIYGITAVG